MPTGREDEEDAPGDLVDNDGSDQQKWMRHGTRNTKERSLA